MIPDHPDEIVEVYKKAITSKTKVISMVHITNTNGMILPVKEICNLARQRGILTVIDAAQSLGAYNCDVKGLGCDFFTASGHKWLFSPKGVALFYSKKGSQKYLKPFIANFHYDKKDISKIDDYNTRNLPDVLGLGAALKFHNMIGVDKMMERTLDLRQLFLDKIQNDSKFRIKTPLSSGLSHHILTVEKVGVDVEAVKESLFRSNGIDVRGMTSHGLNGVRISFAIYQNEKDISRLVSALLES